MRVISTTNLKIIAVTFFIIAMWGMLMFEARMVSINSQAWCLLFTYLIGVYIQSRDEFDPKNKMTLGLIFSGPILYLLLAILKANQFGMIMLLTCILILSLGLFLQNKLLKLTIGFSIIPFAYLILYFI